MKTFVPETKKQKVIAVCGAFFVATLFLLIYSKNSPLYPMNDWVDVNCFLTVGRSMNAGKVLYRDIYEQKGPILYFLYAICAGMFPKSFFGVFILEVSSFAAFLYSSYRIARLFNTSPAMLAAIMPILAFFIPLSKAFAHGGSVEELCLFCLSTTLYVFLKTTRFGKIPPSRIGFFLVGMTAAFAFWIKYTVVGIYIGAYLYILAERVLRGKAKDLVVIIEYSVLGFFTLTLPVILYFGIHNAFGDLWEVYFYNNIFLYSSDVSLKERMVLSLVYTRNSFTVNTVYSYFIAAGLAWLLIRAPREFVLVLMAGLTAAVGTYIGGIAYTYYGLTLAAFSVFGAIAASKTLTWFKGRKLQKVGIAIVCFAVCVLPVLAYRNGRNVYLSAYEKEDLPQYKFAEVISTVENPEILNYGFLDGGFYFASDTIPECRYFCDFNVEAPNKEETVKNYLMSGDADFVITRSQGNEYSFPAKSKYKLVSQASFTFEGYDFNYYLYENRELLK